MKTIALIGLMKMELPTRTVRLCDGGFIVFDGETYQSADDVFGTIASIDTLSEGVGDEVPALEVAFYPNGDATPADLSQPGFQTARTRFWIGEYDVDAGTLIGSPDLVFDGQLDRTQLRVGAQRELSASVVSLAERLFELNIGNSLNSNFHQSVWPGEKGHDNATGLSVPIAWGAVKPSSGAGVTQWAGGGGSGARGYSERMAVI